MLHKTNRITKKLTFLFLIVFSFLLFNSFNLGVSGQTGDIEGTIRVSVCGNNEKEPLEQCDGSDLENKVCLTLGFDSGDLSCRPSCQFLTTSCVTSAEDAEEGVFNKETGGDLELENPSGTGATIQIPVNAFSTDLSLFAFSFLNADRSSNMPAPSGKSFVGNIYEFMFFDESGEKISALLNSPTLTMTYLDSDFTGLAESRIQPYHYNEEDSVWYLVPNSTLDVGENSIAFETTSFSNFALFSSPPDPESPPSPPPSGGSSGSGFLGLLFSPPSSVSTDFNSDGKVDITDLSILLFWWGKVGLQIAPYDLNNDGAIDIIDASILFYHWTG